MGRDGEPCWEEGAEESRQSEGRELKRKRGQDLIMRNILGEHRTDRRGFASHSSSSCLRAKAMPRGSFCLAYLGPVMCDSGL